ncbi:MAG: NADPH-dependent FMN reductase [Candidatus Nanohaloarchaea archaeon]|nr:NADPH-dependent FMN reductase [Candidatus Nanohaloarchaea archaeon]
MTLLIVAGSFSRESKTLELARKAELYGDTIADIDLLKPRNLDLEFCDGRDWDKYNEDVSELQDRFDNADAYIFAVQVYNWSYPGGFKNLIDLVPPDKLSGKVAGFIGVGSNYKGFLFLHRELKSLMDYFNVHTLPNSVFASEADFEGDTVSAEIESRIEELVSRTVELGKKL